MLTLADVLMFYVKSQNATIIARHRGTGVAFECFEVIPTMDAVMEAKNALIRNFPARAIFIPKEIMEMDTFVEELSLAIHRLSTEQLKQSKAVATKAGNVVAEDREAPSPRFVTEWLFGAVLSTYGKVTSTQSVSKRTHDDVLTMGHGIPWRRSGVWLSLRVSLQLALVNSDLDDADKLHYKNFMLFLLAKTATQIMTANSLPSTLHVLRVKLARRMAKLGQRTFSFVQDYVQQTLGAINTAMQAQWNGAIQKDMITISKVKGSDAHNRLALTNSRAHLHMVWNRSQLPFRYSQSQYTPPLSFRVQLLPSLLPQPSVLGNRDDQLTTLVLVENWVEKNLGTWLESHKARASACCELLDFMQAYHQAAAKNYAGHPERMSHMLLTIFELWLAIDVISTNIHPLLLEYPPEIELNIFESLLLDKKAALERLARVELHIKTRQQNKTPGSPSIFSDPSGQCFAVRFFDKSERLLNLRKEVERDAQQVRDQKTAEWREKKRRFEDLMETANGMKCGTYTPRGTDRYGNPYVGRPRHDRFCQKCALEQQAKAIDIAKHEWPLPQDEVQCKAVVFELQAPVAFNAWRDSTWFIVHSLGRSDTNGRQCQQVLLTYVPLARYVQNKNRRITLGSSVKPMIKTHYLRSGLYIDTIFVHNGLVPRLNDTKGRQLVWTAEQELSTVSLSRYCQSRLPSTAPEHLSRQVNSTSHTHNSILAMHSKCPSYMSPHDHVVFGTVRSGEKTQQINMLAMLKSSEADINSKPTAVLVTHAILQVGKRDSQRFSGYLRDSQLDLLNKSFCNSLLSAVEARFASIEANWKEATAANVLLLFPLLILSLCPHAEMAGPCLDMIVRIRQAALRWIRQLAELYSNKRTASMENENLKELSHQIVSSSLLVRRTFHLDTQHLESEFAKNGALTDYVEASIYLHSHKDQALRDDDPKQQFDILTDNCHARRCETHVLRVLKVDDRRISDGIKRFWETASFTASWRTVDDSDTSWIKNDSKNMPVHYNIVTGGLLVDGKPLSRLPLGYTDDPLYRSIFANLDLEVFPSQEEDMEYVSRVDFQGHKIFFGKRGSSLLIRSRKGEDRFEAISRDVFAKDLPYPVLKNTLPWMSLQTGRVVFRRVDSPWSSHGDDWTLSLDVESRPTISMSSNLGSLVDNSSPVGQHICSIFQPFEDANHVLIFKSSGETTGVQIKLPRYHLNFFLLLNGDIKCKELSAMIDQDQSIGTLHGLKNKLVLRAANKVAERSVRTLLIPNGVVAVSLASPHVEVRIQPEKSESLAFSQYRLDGLLGQLASDDLEGHLFKTYLHAITSFPEPDAFTSRTGTEEALFGLSDFVTRTSVPLCDRAQHLLRSLASLSPERSFYPKGHETMHMVVFKKNLPVLAQRDIFYGTVHAIVSHNSRASFLFGGPPMKFPAYPGNTSLLDRSHHRSSKLFANESTADVEKATGDLRYSARDRQLSSAQESAFAMASLVASGKCISSMDSRVRALVQGWHQISGFQQEFSVVSISRMLTKPFEEHWASLLSWCRASPPRHSLAFTFSLMIYGDQEIAPQLQALLAFSVSLHLQRLPAPECDTYELNDRHSVRQQEIQTFLSQCEKQYSPSPGDDDQKHSEDRRIYDAETAAQRNLVMQAVQTSWPGSTVDLPPRRVLSHFNYPDLQTLLNGRFATWYRNYKFLSLCDDYERTLRSIKVPWTPQRIPVSIVQPEELRPESVVCPTRPSLLAIMKTVHLTDRDFCESRPSMLDHNLSDIMQVRQRPQLLNANEKRVALESLEDILDEKDEDEAPIVRNYYETMKESLIALRNVPPSSSDPLEDPSQMFLREKARHVQTRIDYILNRCQELLNPRHLSEQGLVGARLWPSVSNLALLQLLSAERRPQLPMPWKKIILRFAEEITALQRVERMQKYLAANDTFALESELKNPAHAAWSTEEHPDWLLLEIQNLILIRPIQVLIAEKIIEQESGVVLADMGIGKSSTILPMVVTSLADARSLVRVIVLKPLANEMLRILSRSLSGLVGRAVYFLPISRQTMLAETNAQKLREIYESCIENSGVLVSLPEHLNSFRLLCNDKLHSNPNLAHELFRIQKFLDLKARDIIDESDQVLEPGYELVYTTGVSVPLSRSPERWIVALEMLELIRQSVDIAQDGLEVERRATDAFDHIRILNEAGSKALMTSLVDAILKGGLPSVPLGHCNSEELQALKTFIQDADVDPETLSVISSHFEGSSQLEILYIVRGLITYQILSHALRKRWLVNYGLDRSRPGGCLAAVPYRAKAVPSQSSEFAQPETMIILTTLSYYYSGLLYQELRQCILVLLRLPDPSEEFSKWAAKSSLPHTYRKASSINLDDASCLDILYQCLRLNKATIDFFLKNKVFPKEAREFKWKLSTSAWDLCASNSVRVTTGFSGTCDSQIPFTVKMKDLPGLKHSIASTLATILRFENRRYICASSPGGQRLSTEEMLDLIVGQDKERSVIIDVGAQFLEDNKEIAAKWLKKREKKLAAIFFNDNDEKMVLNRDGTTEKFNSSIFKDEIGSCLIYLDEFHTRGTDFQLPDSFAAAVLLGPRIPKDSLVQACMRMRKLAATQSVIFIAPPEVDQSIRAVTETPSEEINSAHVVRWALHQSCLLLKHQHALCTTKGLQHSRRRIAAADHIDDNGFVSDPQTYLDTIREQESRPVSEMYRLDQNHGKELPFQPSRKELNDEIMANQMVNWNQIDIGDFTDGGLSEEQEREVLHEVEEEREVERPREVVPAVPAECKALLNLIEDGTMPTGSFDGILPAFEVLKTTKLAAHYSQASWPMQILATADFMRTIKSREPRSQDDFLRPVQWVLHAKRIKQPIIISPHEANVFMDSIRRSKRATLFLYQARVSKSMASFDKLDVYKIPENDNGVRMSPEQVAILNLFAGQLYFNTFEDYKVLCGLIGLWDGERDLPVRRKVANDNWVAPACRKANGWDECTFKSSPVETIKSFINMRRLGIEWSHTHMGRILAGRLLSRKDFEEEEDVPTEASASQA